jgi:hypothetical protein
MCFDNWVAISIPIAPKQKSTIAAGDVQVASSTTTWMMKIFVMLPPFLRNMFFWQPLFRDPFRFKRMMGTVSVTSISMFGGGSMSWGIPIGIHPLLIAVGGIDFYEERIDIVNTFSLYWRL